MVQVKKFLFEILLIKFISISISFLLYIKSLMRKFIILLISFLVLWGMSVFAASCAKEWQNYNNWMDAQWPFSCCSGLKWFTGWVNSEYAPLCYNKSKWTPICKKIWTIKWRYYTNWKLLKKDSNCKIKTNASCLKEWQNYNNWMDAQWPFSCCSGLKWFTGWVNSEYAPLCYNKSKWTPICKKVWTIKWRYYTSWTLLKKDNECAKYTQ